MRRDFVANVSHELRTPTTIIMKHTVQLHGGAVSVASEPGKGSQFSFTIKKEDNGIKI